MDKRKKLQEAVDEILQDSNLKNEFIKTRLFLKKYFDGVVSKFDKFDQLVSVLRGLKFPDSVKVSNLNQIPKTVVNVPDEVSIKNWPKDDELKSVLKQLADKPAKEEKAEPTYTCIVDESNPGTTYVGEALPGSKATNTVWRIQKLSVISGVSYIEYADGNDKYDNSWDKRKTLDYS